MNIIGIDLGTTYCAVSKINAIGKPEIIAFSDGARLIPSVMFFDKKNKILVGEAARRSANRGIEKYVSLVKRYMGEEYYPQEILGKKQTPAYLTSVLLRHIKDDFESRYGSIDRAVVTVPAYFDEKRRSATLEAAKMAGLNVQGLLNEPTAAGLYYSTQYKELNGKVLIFDLGGGTFDVTILDVVNDGTNTTIDVVSSNGDHKLGGKDFDYLILEELAKEYKNKKGVDLYHSKEEELDFLETYAENKFKKPLATEEEIIDNRVVGEEGSIRFNFSRNDFENLISNHIQKVEMLVEGLLYENEFEPSDIDHVLLVGGSSRITYFQDYLRQLFNQEPKILGNVDEAVALGASIECLRRATDGGRIDTIDGIRLPQEIILEVSTQKVQDVCNHSYGTIANAIDELSKTYVRTNSIIIPKNTAIPCTIEKTFYLVVDNQKSVDISVTQGESKDPDEVNIIFNGQMELDSSTTKQGDEIIVEYSYDINQRMSCVFTHKKTGRQHPIFLDKVEWFCGL